MGEPSDNPRSGRSRGHGERTDPQASFETVALPHLDAVYRMALVLTRDQVESEDLAQETFTRAFRAFKGFELREYGARPWLLRILHNVFYTHKGKQRRAPTLLDDVDFDSFAEEVSAADPGPASADLINWDQVDEELKVEVDRLKPEYRSVLLLWAIEGLSYKEIAEVCDCPLGTVMSRLYRARQILGKTLNEYAMKRRLNTQRFE